MLKGGLCLKYSYISKQQNDLLGRPIPFLPAVKLIGFPLVLLASVIWHKICGSLFEKLKGTFKNRGNQGLKKIISQNKIRPVLPRGGSF
jgi:hypothetical protein